MRRSLLRYLLVGCVNTVVGLGLIYLCMYALGMGNVPANLIGYAVGVLVSFLLNKSWTFAHEGRYLPALGRFLVVLLVAYGANLLTVLSLSGRCGFNRYAAQAMGVIPYTLIGYLGSRWFAFRATAAAGAVSAQRFGAGE